MGETWAYLRVSTTGQETDGMGLGVQRDAIAAFAALHGHDVTTWYQDVESGAKERREGLDTVRAAVAAGKVRTLLVYRLDRIARDVLLSETVHRELASAGCRVLSVSEAIDDSPAGNLMRMIIAAFAQYERAVIALRTSSGRKARVASTGSYHGGGVPFGYQAVGKRGMPGNGALTIHADQAAIVREVFHLRAAGSTMEGIAACLNAAGHVTAEGTAFTRVQIHRILKRALVYRAKTVTTPSVSLAAGVQPMHAPILAPIGE